MKGPKLLFLGFDGLDSERVLRDGGAFADWHGLRGECVPEIAATGPSWATIYTGMRVGQHGITNTWGKPDKDAMYAKANLPWLWRDLNKQGHTCGVIGLPVTWPAQEIDGWMVSGVPAPVLDARAQWPPDLETDGYIIDYMNAVMPRGPEVGQWRMKADSADAAWDTMQQVAWRRVQVAARLYRLRPVDCLMIGFTFPDRYGHTIIAGGFGERKRGWSAPDQLARKITRQLIGGLSPKVTVIVSDHGFDNRGHTDHGIYLQSGQRDEIKLHNWDVKERVMEAMA